MARVMADEMQHVKVNDDDDDNESFSSYDDLAGFDIQNVGPRGSISDDSLKKSLTVREKDKWGERNFSKVTDRESLINSVTKFK